MDEEQNLISFKRKRLCVINKNNPYFLTDQFNYSFEKSSIKFCNS